MRDAFSRLQPQSAATAGFRTRGGTTGIGPSTTVMSLRPPCGNNAAVGRGACKGALRRSWAQVLPAPLWALLGEARRGVLGASPETASVPSNNRVLLFPTDKQTTPRGRTRAPYHEDHGARHAEFICQTSSQREHASQVLG